MAYNRCVDGVSVWPQSLRRYFVTIHLRDVDGNGQPLLLGNSVFQALKYMPRLTTLTVRATSPSLPSDFVDLLAELTSLSVLELHQTRLDAPRQLRGPVMLSALHSLVIRTSGFFAICRPPDLDVQMEQANIQSFLAAVSGQLCALTVSGDLISASFAAISWPKLTSFSITEHPPVQQMHLHQLVGRMPLLDTLHVLFTADLANNRLPPFSLTEAEGDLAYMDQLTTVSISNVAFSDPVFCHLPPMLLQLHLIALGDVFDAQVPRHRRNRFRHSNTWEARMNSTEAQQFLRGLGTFSQLSILSIALSSQGPGELIASIAAVAPQLRDLAIHCLPHDNNPLVLIDFEGRAQAIFAELRLFHGLESITWGLQYITHEAHPGPPSHAAYRHFREVPGLQWVTYIFGGYFDTIPSAPLVFSWERGMLLHPEPPRIINTIRSASPIMM
ncbi:hypothetical protein MIND_00809000 [Mycena indigotica]|uniref:F-box domain-containing protein n=1 Tax=Mycena indigotica TaxID=2126181 RepID=A0A8H6VYB7_9AGAR|nr:uncharacterized protein MIND_00809000 [Mycena indigotica]KAF7298619.1 hypothetical protein MIND_00809000 [Mycena indigotica]